MPASQPQAMTDVAKPVIVTAACCAQLGRIGRDDDRGRAHAERLGKGVVDCHAVPDQLRHGTSSKTASTPAAVATADSRTSVASSGRP